MASTNSLHKAKMTITINNDIALEIDRLARKRKTPRSKIMEDMLRESLIRNRKKKIENDIENYYLSLSEEDKIEDKEWTKISKISAKRLWND